MTRLNAFVLAALAVGLQASFIRTAEAQDEAPKINISPVTDAMLANPDPADWLMWRRTLNNWGYSPLDQVNRRNVKELRLVWARPLTNGDQEGTPLIHDGIMYFPNPNAGQTILRRCSLRAS